MPKKDSTPFPKYFKHCFQVLRTRDRGYLEYSLCAAIVSGGRILSTGVNKQKKHGIVEAYKNNEWCNMHAEIDAILQVRRKIDLTGSKMYVARMTMDGVICNAKPCDMCLEVIRNYGIKRVLYTIDPTSWGVLVP